MAGDCQRRACQCPHLDPCDFGWLELAPQVKKGNAYSRVAACPVCRPEAASRYEKALRRASRDLGPG